MTRQVLLFLLHYLVPSAASVSGLLFCDLVPSAFSLRDLVPFVLLGSFYAWTHGYQWRLYALVKLCTWATSSRRGACG